MKNAKDSLIGADFRSYLMQAYWIRSRRNHRYSFRAFAKDLEIDVSSLRKIINGKRRLGKKVMLKLGTNLGLNQSELEKFCLREAAKSQLSLAKQTVAHRLLTVEEVTALYSWVPFAILELMELKKFVPSEHWIAESLQISLPEVVSAIEVLVQVGFLKKGNTWEKCVGPTDVDPTDTRIKQARHRLITEITQKCSEALHKFPREVRTHSANTVAINSSRLPEALAKIQAFRMELAEFLGEGTKDQVYQILVGVYPLSSLGISTSGEAKPAVDRE